VIFRVIVHKALGEKVFSFLAINIRKNVKPAKQFLHKEKCFSHIYYWTLAMAR